MFNDRVYRIGAQVSTESIFTPERIHASSLERTRRLTADIRQTIRKMVPRGRLLDVGCGLGEFLSLFPPEHYEVQGVEPSQVAAEHALQKFGISVCADHYRQNLFNSQRFDVITALQVFEHLRDPRQFLAAVYEHLRPGGVVVIDVPSYNNPRFLFYRLTGLSPIVKRDFIPSHLFYYTRRTLVDLAASAGFRIRKVTCGRYSVKFGSTKPVLRAMLTPIDWIANRIGVGGIVLYSTKPR